MTASYQDPPRPWTRTSTVLLVLLALGACTTLFFWVLPIYDINDAANDASLYILCAKSIVSGEGYAYLGMPFTVRPPGLSLLLAPILALRGVDFHALNLFISLWGVACVCMLYVYAHRWVGPWIALALAVLVWVTPGFQRLCNMPMSDVPGAALVLACLLVERWTTKKQKVRREIVLGVAIALAAYMRSVAVLLVPAIICARVVVHARERSAEKWLVFLRRRALLFSATTVLVLLPWSIRDTLSRPDPPADQSFLWSYSTAMWHADGGDPNSRRLTAQEILARPTLHSGATLSVLGTNLGTPDGPTWSLWLGLAALSCLVVMLVRRSGAGEFFALAVVAVLSVYFAFQARLVLPVWLFALVGVADTLVWLLSKPFAPRIARGAVAIALALLSISAGLVRYDAQKQELVWRPRASWPMSQLYFDAYRSMTDDFRAALAPDAVPASAIGWHNSVFLDQPVYSLTFTARRFATEAAVEALIDKYGINTVTLSKNVAADVFLMKYFKDKYGPATGTETNLVFRVRK
ncbi:MAG: ArnT family glycosyltransferase [Planctomycetota bacterium]